MWLWFQWPAFFLPTPQYNLITCTHECINVFLLLLSTLLWRLSTNHSVCVCVCVCVCVRVCISGVLTCQNQRSTGTAGLEEPLTSSWLATCPNSCFWPVCIKTKHQSTTVCVLAGVKCYLEIWFIKLSYCFVQVFIKRSIFTNLKLLLLL